MLDVPDVGVSTPFHIGFGLVDGDTEAVIDLLVDAVFGFVPDQRRHTVDRGFQILVCLPVVLAHLIMLLPFCEMKTQFGVGQRECPDIMDRGHAAGQIRETCDLFLVREYDEFCVLPFFREQDLYCGRYIHVLHIRDDDIRL